MKPNNVIANLNKLVEYQGSAYPELRGKPFVFSGATIRRKTNQHGKQGKPFYQAEIQSKSTRALYIVNLEDIEVLEE